MNRESVLQIGFVDIAAILFAVGGVASLVMSLLTIPVVSAQLPVTFITVFFVILAIDLICSLGALHCYTLATKRMLSEAGMRGLIFGALLLIFSLGFVANFIAATATVILAELSAALSSLRRHNLFRTSLHNAFFFSSTSRTDQSTSLGSQKAREKFQRSNSAQPATSHIDQRLLNLVAERV